MKDEDSLVRKVITSLTLETGKWVIDGLKRLCNPNIVKAAETLTANPDNDKAKKILVDELKKGIEESPTLAQDLSNVLSQSATIRKGKNITITQVQGHHNRT